MLMNKWFEVKPWSTMPQEESKQGRNWSLIPAPCHEASWGWPIAWNGAFGKGSSYACGPSTTGPPDVARLPGLCAGSLVPSVVVLSAVGTLKRWGWREEAGVGAALRRGWAWCCTTPGAPHKWGVIKQGRSVSRDLASSFSVMLWGRPRRTDSTTLPAPKEQTEALSFPKHPALGTLS